MTEPTRWSDAKAELDPVLRSVVRYGQSLGPSPEQLQRLLRVVAPRQAPTTRRGWRRFAVGAGLGFAAAFGGVAWASYGGWFGSPHPGASATPPAPSAPALGAKPPESPIATAAEPTTVVPVPTLKARPAPVASIRDVSSLAAPPSTADDTELLQQARAALGSDAGRALGLTREHERRFPRSALSEERSALRIEALVGLAEAGAAARELAVFERSYPRSPYRRRLRSLVSP